MPRFTTGLVIGVGIAVLFAPLSGKDMRQLINNRIQQLRTSVNPPPEHLQIPSPPAHTTQSTHTEGPAHLPTSQSIDNASTEPTSSSIASDTTQTTNGTPSEAVPEPAIITTTNTQPAQQDTIPANERLITGAEATELTQQPAFTQPQDASPLETDTEDADRTIALPSPIKYTMHSTSKSQNDLNAIPAMTPDLHQTFEQAGITTQQQLLQRTPTKEAASDLAHSIGTSVRTMRHVVTCADLLRLPGADSDTAALLEQAGVTGCQDLQQRNPEHLHTKLVELQAQQNTPSHIPDLDQLTRMISAASDLTTGKA